MYIYGVFIVGANGRAQWLMSRSKKRALAFARAHRGLIGRVRNCPEYTSFDAPTFRALMDLIADYREVIAH